MVVPIDVLPFGKDKKFQYRLREWLLLHEYCFVVSH